MKPSRNVPATFKPLTFTLDWSSSESNRHNPSWLEGFSVQEHGAGIFFSLNLVLPFRKVNTGFNAFLKKKYMGRKCRGKIYFLSAFYFVTNA